MAVEPNEGVATRYVLLLSKGGRLTPAELQANALSVSAVPEDVSLPDIEFPGLSGRDITSFCFYQTLPDCSGKLQCLDLATPDMKTVSVWGDAPQCDREPTAVVPAGNIAYLSYGEPGSGIKETLYFIKAVTLDGNLPPFEDAPLEKTPLQLLVSGDRLFVLGYDDSSGKNFLLVLGAATGELEKEIDLGTGVQALLKNPEGNLLVSYENRHLILHRQSLDILSNVQYNEGVAPRFGNLAGSNFDSRNTLYYVMDAASTSSAYPHIPAVFDFSSQTAYLYLYENYLTPAEQTEAYNIGDTKVVGYDPYNGYLLIGYQQAGNAEAGGILRIKPVPEPKFIDQLSLDGIPVQVVVP